MNRDEARRRAEAGLPIESAHELVHALNAIRERVRANSALWYMMNRFTREVLDLDKVERVK